MSVSINFHGAGIDISQLRAKAVSSGSCIWVSVSIGDDITTIHLPCGKFAVAQAIAAAINEQTQPATVPQSIAAE